MSIYDRNTPTNLLNVQQNNFGFTCFETSNKRQLAID